MKEHEISHYFDILGLTSGASQRQIKEAYKDLVKVWHPDRFLHDPKLRVKAQEKLKEINDAYERVLIYCASSSNQANHTNEANSGTAAKQAARPTSEEQQPKGNDKKADNNNDHSTSGKYKYTRETSDKNPTPESTNEEYTPITYKPGTLSNKIIGIVVVVSVLIIFAAVLAYKSASDGNQSLSSVTNSANRDTTNSSVVTSNSEAVSDTNSGGTEIPSITDGSSDSNTSDQESLDDLVEGDQLDVEPLRQADGNPDYPAIVSQVESATEPKVSGLDAAASGYFSLNSTRDEVLRIQGTPDSIIGNSFSYGYSSVSFQNNQVVGWSNIGRNLRVKMSSGSSRMESYFTLGSSRADVVKLQGTPESIIGHTYGYGYSSVQFRGDSVVGWSNISRNLKVRLFSKSEEPLHEFTIGSSKDDVVKVQGTPDSIIGNSFGYGYSTVNFRDDRVTNWSNIGRNLRVNLRPSQ